MKRILLLSFALLFVIGLATDSGAVMGGKAVKKGRGMGNMETGCMCGEHRMTEMIKSLGLDEKQTEEVNAIHNKLQKEVIRKGADVEVKSIEMREIMSKDPVDLKEAEAKIREIEALKSDMKIMHIRAHEEIRGKLTPEQKKKFKSMMGMHSMGCMDMMDCGMGMKSGGMMRKGGKAGMMKGPGMMGDGDSMGPE